MRSIPCTAAVLVGLAAATIAAHDAPAADAVRIRTHDDLFITRPAPTAPPTKDARASQSSHRGPADPVRCDLNTRVKHGDVPPHGGGFGLGAFFNPATINDQGNIAFFSEVFSNAQNQGVFTAGVMNVGGVAVGCGPFGGSSDPPGVCGEASPIGGTFSGFFAGTFMTPDINNNNDVLFFADVVNGSASRGLFLRDGTSGAYHVVAAVGDPSPFGGIFSEVGLGSLNNLGEVVFIARTDSALGANIFKWTNGAVTRIVAVGDPAPGGGTFNHLGTESLGFADGTNIPVGPLPDINDAGQIAFRGEVTGGQSDQGIFVVTNGVMEWYAERLTPAPVEGQYALFQAPIINEVGQVTFFADIDLGDGAFTSGWFAGEPGSFRRAIAFLDAIGGGEVVGLAFSRNPMQPIDNHGNVLVWTAIELPSTEQLDALVLVRPDGTQEIVAQRGEPAPHGGTITSMDAWPSLNHQFQGTLSSGTAGVPGSFSAHMVFDLCVDDVPGDLTGDGVVNLFDLLDLLAAWGPCPGACPPSCAADFTNSAGTGSDCTVNLFDLLFLLANWG